MNNRTNNYLELIQNTLSRLESAEAREPNTIAASILQQFQQLIDLLMEQKDAAYDLGQDLLCQIATHQPQLMPVIERELFWFFGGECLHYLTDEEITQFQRIDEENLINEEQPSINTKLH